MGLPGNCPTCPCEGRHCQWLHLHISSWCKRFACACTNDQGYVCVYRCQNRSFPYWLFTWFVTGLTRWVPHVEQELLTLPGYLSSPQHFSGFHAISLVFCVMFCRPLFYLLHFFSFDSCIVCPYIRFWYLQTWKVSFVRNKSCFTSGADPGFQVRGRT